MTLIPIEANPPTHSLTFAQLSQHYDTWSTSPENLMDRFPLLNQRIKIRGFLHPISTENAIFSGEPDLRSCCVGSPNKRGSQILIHSPIPEASPLKAVTLEGILQVDLKSSRHFYVLHDVTLIAETSSYLLVIIFCLAPLALILLIYLWSTQIKKRRKLITLIQSNITPSARITTRNRL